MSYLLIPNLLKILPWPQACHSDLWVLLSYELSSAIKVYSLSTPKKSSVHSSTLSSTERFETLHRNSGLCRPEIPTFSTFLLWLETFRFRRIERFSNDCRKTKTKAITPTNHNRNKQRDEPITIPSNHLWLARSAGKITRIWCGWFWFCVSLVEKLARVF